MKKFFYLLGIFAVVGLTNCSKDKEDPMEDAYKNASVSKGGIMYDKFWAQEAEFDQNHASIATLNAKPDFFRCKQCHGWDLLGTQGAYINRGPKTSRPNVSSVNLLNIAQTKSYKELFEAMKKTAGRRDITYDLSTYDPATNNTEGDKMPNYTQLLTDAQIWDIVKFLKEGYIPVAQLYDFTLTGDYPTGSIAYSNIGMDGNETAGLAYYQSKCQSCHGADGKLIPVESMSVGKFLRSKPNEVQHKVKFGQLGTSMSGQFSITNSQMKDLYKALTNTTNFPD